MGLSSREKQRRRRSRERSGIALLPIAVNEVRIAEVLTIQGYLHPSVADQRDKIRDALERMIDDIYIQE